MKRRICADNTGIVAEMFKCATDEYLYTLLDCFNNMLTTGNLDPSWQESLFTMLPKSGDRSDVQNWRPIAILRMSYKIFARLIYARIKNQLDAKQSANQRGFKPKCRIDDAFII